MAGCLVCIVGPSGAGKDSLIAYARHALASDSQFHFARRVVTRPSTADEDHDTLSDQAFIEADLNGEFFLSWRAHFLAYALRAEVGLLVDSGHCVIANISRAVLESEVLRRLPCLIVEVTAREDLLAARLAARGRESGTDIQMRLTRKSTSWPADLAHITIDNSGKLQDAGEILLTILRRASQGMLPQAAV
jgi:ribose 1,5-bisphosphokinase